MVFTDFVQAAMKQFKVTYPGLRLVLEDRPTDTYMGILEDMHRRQGWKGETLKKVVCIEAKMLPSVAQRLLVLCGISVLVCMKNWTCQCISAS